MTAVFDTSPIQALWRGGVLANMPTFFDRCLIPDAVELETTQAHANLGSALVPDLRGQGWIETQRVDERALRHAIERLFEVRWRRKYGAGAPPPRPSVEIDAEKVCATFGRLDRCTISVPDLSVLALAMGAGAVVVVDDKGALRAAAHLGLGSATSYELIRELERRGSIASTREVLNRISATGYFPTIRPKTGWPPG